MTGRDGHGGGGGDAGAAGGCPPELASRALAALVPGYAHDLNNVLGGLQGLLSALRVSSGLDADAREDIELMLDAVRRGLDHVARLAAVASPSAEAPQAVPVGEALTQVARALRRTTRAPIAVTAHGDPPLARVAPAALERLAAPLLRAANDAVGRDGVLEVHVGPGEARADGEWVSVRLRATSGEGGAAIARALAPEVAAEAERLGGQARAVEAGVDLHLPAWRG